MLTVVSVSPRDENTRAVFDSLADAVDHINLLLVDPGVHQVILEGNAYRNEEGGAEPVGGPIDHTPGSHPGVDVTEPTPADEEGLKPADGDAQSAVAASPEDPNADPADAYTVEP